MLAAASGGVVSELLDQSIEHASALLVPGALGLLDLLFELALVVAVAAVGQQVGADALIRQVARHGGVGPVIGMPLVGQGGDGVLVLLRQVECVHGISSIQV